MVCLGVHVGEDDRNDTSEPGDQHERPMEDEPNGQVVYLRVGPLVLVVASQQHRDGDQANPDGNHERSMDSDEDVRAERLDVTSLGETDGGHRADPVGMNGFV